MRTPEEVIAEARTWIGCPFLHQGRTRHGIDCIGQFIVVGRSLGLVAPDFDYTGYGREPLPGELERVVALNGCVRHDGEPRPGMMVLIKWHKQPQHAALVGHSGEYETLIHAGGGFSSCVEHRLDAKWRKRIHSVWLLPGVEY